MQNMVETRKDQLEATQRTDGRESVSHDFLRTRTWMLSVTAAPEPGFRVPVGETFWQEPMGNPIGWFEYRVRGELWLVQ